MDEETKPFTVRDRRKFTPDGTLRTEDGWSDAGEPEASPATAGSPPEPARPELPGPPGEEAADFPSFLVSLASQASLYLTSTEGSAGENLGGARHMISILEMLDDKTRGRRTPQEDQLLEQILYELRMAYVERSRSVGM
jgi:hypothetical protein